MLREDLKHITTEHLRDTCQLSTRAAGCCIKLNLGTLDEIVLFFKNTGSFSRLRMKNAGRKTLKELDKFCAKILSKKENISKKENTSNETPKVVTTINLLNTNQLPIRAVDCCLNLGLDTLDKIILFFKNTGSFSQEKTKNVGRKTLKDLDKFCENILSKKSNIPTVNLLNPDQLSVRAVDCCLSLGLDTLDKIMLFFKKTGTFSKVKIKNTGPNISKELDKFCTTIVLKEETISNEKLKYITIENLQNTGQISLRAANYCKNANLHTLYKLVCSYKENQSFYKKATMIKDSDRKICEELSELCKKFIQKIRANERRAKVNEISEVANLLNELSEKEREMLLSLSKLIVEEEMIMNEKNKDFIHYCPDNFSFAIDFYNKNGHFPMFWILEQYLIHDKAQSIRIFTATTPIFQNKKPITLRKIAANLKLSCEYVRKIRNIVFSQVFQNIRESFVYQKDNQFFKYAQLLQNKNDWAYIIHFLQETCNIYQGSVEFKEYLREQEQCNLSVKFVLQIIANIFRDKYTLFGGFNFSYEKQDCNNTHLIKKDFTDIFDFEKFRENFANLITHNEIIYSLKIEDYVANSPCWLKPDFDKLDDIVSIVRVFLSYEFALSPKDITDIIKVPAMKKLNLSRVIYEILKTNGEPMSLIEIFNEFQKIAPEHKYSLENNPNRLRRFVCEHDAISFRKQNSIFTLTEWTHRNSD